MSLQKIIDNGDAFVGITNSTKKILTDFYEIVMVPGDLDDDGDVDSDDRAIILNALGSCEGDTEFVPEADYNQDGCITFFEDFWTWIWLRWKYDHQENCDEAQDWDLDLDGDVDDDDRLRCRISAGGRL